MLHVRETIRVWLCSVLLFGRGVRGERSPLVIAIDRTTQRSLTVGAGSTRLQEARMC